MLKTVHRRTSSGRLLAALMTTCALTAPVAAMAQSNEIDEIVVTGERAAAATKTDAALTEVPQGISVVTADEIQSRSVVDFQDVFRYTAGVAAATSVDSRGDFVVSRGFDAAQYLDGLKRMPDFIYGARLEPFTVQSVEVLRGPSSVLYGAGGPGGVLNGVSKTPRFETAGEVGVVVGTDDRIQGQLDYTTPLNDKLAVRMVSVWRDGKTQWGTPDDRLVLNPSVKFEITPKTDITLIGLYQKDKQGSLGYVPLFKSFLADNDAEKLPFNFWQGEKDFNKMDTEFTSIGAIFNHRFSDNISFRSATRYSDMNTDYQEVYTNYTAEPWADAAETLLRREFYVNYENSQVLNTDNNVNVAFKTGPISHKVLVGLDYLWFKQNKDEGFSYLNFYPFPSPPPINAYNPQPTGPFPFGAFNFLDYRSTQLGLYVQDQMSFADRVHIVLGLRRDEAGSRRNGVDEADQVKWSFRGGIIAEVVKGLSPYFNYAESFLPVPGGDFFGNPYTPRTARQYEGGVKWEPVRGALFTASYFDIEESNFISQDPTNVQNFIQGGVVGSKGFEAEAVIRMPRDFDVTASYSYIDAKVLESSTTLTAGNRIAAQPRELASLWGTKTFKLGNEWTIRAGGGVRHVGDRIDAGMLLKQPSVTLFDAMFTAFYQDWEFSVTSSNLFNKQYYDICNVYGPNSGTCVAAKDRTVLASVRRRF
ncbi:TonB-dependent siderophore receptor [Caulobacter segnis]|uniref:TonB-dependent siderophore receptor n=1 Tax=Caulobacter segnis TaxID=88688 RepID=UPI0024105D26|nr:TonB-dependent siderophore receptor [Caulobacter segnis]MDG2523018.1 TonB-dependent siderophore receptor [Caulobacter segnis]